jgi:predicted porin
MKFGFVNEHGFSPTSAQDWTVRTANAAPAINGTAAATATADNAIPGAGAISTGTNRGTFVSLGGGFGEVRAGYLVNDSYNLSSQSGYLLGMEQYGGLTHTAGQAETGGARGNGLQYISPVFNGFKLSLQQGSGDQRAETTSTAVNNGYTSNEEKRTGMRVDYANGPLNVAYANTKLTNVKAIGGGGLVTSIFGVAGATNATATDQKNKLDQLAASYTMGAWKAIATSSKATVDNSDNTKDRTIKANSYGLQYTTGAWTVYGQGGKQTQDSSTARVNDVKQTQYGVKYALSKRTTAYYVTGESKDSAVTGATQVAKGQVSLLGLSHSF